MPTIDSVKDKQEENENQEEFNFDCTISQINNCDFSKWYPKYKKISLKSHIIPLEEEFINYLNEDGIYLPFNDNGQPQKFYQAERDEYDSDWSSDEYEDEDEDEANNKIPSFPLLEKQINTVIEEFNGKVFPKLNWSAPKDAAWISISQSLKCTNPSEIFLLLKSSDFINHDISHAYENCSDYKAPSNEHIEKPDSKSQSPQVNEKSITRPETFHLVLRKWYDLLPSMEFRCFVRDNELIGICQRDYVTYYDFLHEIKDELEDIILDFFEDHIKGTFDDPNYVFDVYINKRNRRIFLLDFNPFSITTDALLFNWPELLKLNEFEFRLVESEAHAKETSHGGINPIYSTNCVPKELIDFGEGKTLLEFTEKFAKELQQMSLKEDDDSDDDDNNNKETNTNSKASTSDNK
ncbi:D123-domain-containing protein [Anaeromyces robustus]|uniref:D123-domain-containing protein n=1 Tax=Anaeromyces robustus TaxID=1754192 RepID=A0A1Y1VVK9_9FUNG|nr:D123-domain-containing protein [Anaeromyces robustus]|eukprot:ORX65321.1 D123-domain-containing protein [Anaeromyces robustus]